MKTLVAEKTQEEIVLQYLDAFRVNDVTRMLELVHPAIHYERSVDGILETVVNGSAEFELHASQNCQFDERTLKLTRLKNDKDFTELEFTVTRRDQPSQQLEGHAIFWFSEGKIFQQLIRVDSV